MNQMKKIYTSAGAVTLAALIAIGGLAACNRSDMNQRGESGAGEQQQPLDQNVGKSYVKEIPPEEVKRKETEMTSDEVRDKGPAVGSQTPNPDERQQKDQDQQPVNNP